jgi:hypothetical protein
MTLEQSGRTSYRWLTITLLVAAGAYGWYAIGQYGRLNELNQRQLSNAGAELKLALDTAVETITRFNRKWIDWKTAKKPAPRPGEGEPRVCDFDRSQPYLELEACENVGWAAFSKIEPTVTPALGIEASGGESLVRFRFLTDTLLKELAIPDAFSLIFVATEDGRILYQDAPVRRRWLRRLRWGEQTFRDASAERPPIFQVQDLQEVLGGGETWKQLRSVSSQTRIRIGGSMHQLYLHPLVLENGKRTNLVIGGAVPTTLLIRDALALNTYLLGVLVFLLLLGVLGFPFVKLASLDPRERFRLRDIHLLYLSTGALLVLVTCALLALDGYVRWHTVADDGLKAVAGDLEWRLRREITEIRDQVAVYDSDVSQLQNSSCEQWPVRTNWFQDTESAGQAVAPGPQLPRPVGMHLSQVAWIRSDGWQIWKSTADAIQGTTQVDRRVYFRAVKDGHLFEIPDEGAPGARYFFLGPDRSISDGKFYTFLSMRSGMPSAFCGGSIGHTPVVAATVQLLSLDRQALPAGYGFAVVNREGRVLYHSDHRLSLRENFFEELSDGNRARALMYAGRSDTLKSRYREAPHEFYFQPVGFHRAGERELAGLYVAAFRDTSVERAVIGHAFVTGLAGPMVLLLGLYALGLWGIALASRYTDQSSSAWLWPHGGLEHIYHRQSLAFLALLAGSVAFYLMTRSIAVFLTMPVLAAGAGIAIYVHGKRHAAPRRRLSAASWQTAALLLVLVCMIVGPSAALFRLTLSHEFAKMILTERAWVAAQRRDALRAAEVEALAEGYGRSQCGVRKKARQAHFVSVPKPFDTVSPRFPLEPESLKAHVPPIQHAATVTEPSAPPRPVESRVECPDSDDLLSASKPSAELQPLGWDARLIDALHWPSDALPIENVIFLRQHFQDGPDREYAYSPDGTLITWLRVSGTGLAGFGLMLGLLIWWIRWNTNRLFLADVETDEATAAPSAPFDQTWEKCTEDEQMVLLQVARERLANPHQRRMIRHLIGRGLLRLNPDVRPSTDEFDDYLRNRECQLRAQISAWQRVNVGHSWRYVRLILAVCMTGLGFFLVATQPGLQSSLIGIATGITGALTTGLKLRDAVAAWFAERKSAA